MSVGPICHNAIFDEGITFAAEVALLAGKTVAESPLPVETNVSTTIISGGRESEKRRGKREHKQEPAARGIRMPGASRPCKGKKRGALQLLSFLSDILPDMYLIGRRWQTCLRLHQHYVLRAAVAPRVDAGGESGVVVSLVRGYHYPL